MNYHHLTTEVLFKKGLLKSRIAMTFFYRGAGVGTYWHKNDARLHGFTAQSPGAQPTVDRLINHIAKGTVTTPFLSLTRSFGVACSYAAFCGRGTATKDNPGYVYQVELDEPLPAGLQLIDPLKSVAEDAADPLDPPYQHDGLPDFLLGVVSPTKMGDLLKIPYLQPPPGGGTERTPNLTEHFETLVRVLRDAEILACGTIPAKAIENRFLVFWDGFQLQVEYEQR